MAVVAGLNFFGPQILLCLPRGRPLVDTPWIIAATPPMVHSLLASTTPYPCPCPCPIFVCLFGLLIFCHGFIALVDWNWMLLIANVVSSSPNPFLYRCFILIFDFFSSKSSKISDFVFEYDILLPSQIRSYSTPANGSENIHL